MIDENVKFLRRIVSSFSECEGGKGNARHKSFTSETKAATVNTIWATLELCNYLLSIPQFRYVMISEFHTDSLEAEFGVYRQMSGGNYFVSVEQVLLSARLRRMKLMTLLECSYEHKTSSCCTSALTEDELSSLDSCCNGLENLSENEKASLYYISGEF